MVVEGENDMCEFCKKFDFNNAKVEVDKYGARIHLALGMTKIPKEEQFKYCPVCGEKRSERNGD